MPFRLYLVPVIGTGATKDDARRPKYFETLTDWSAMDYGFEPVMVVGASLTVSDDASIIAQPDVTALPFDLAPTLTGGQVTAVRNALEALHIPALWVTTADTWIGVVRSVLGVFSFFQRFGGIYATQTGQVPPSLFGGGVTLNTTFGSLPLAVRTALLETATSFSLSTAGFTGGTTLRVLLKALADAFGVVPYNFNGVLL